MKSYPFITAWGRQLGSLPYYVAMQRALARQQDAPFNAVFKDGDVWVTTDDLSEEVLKRLIHNLY